MTSRIFCRDVTCNVIGQFPLCKAACVGESRVALVRSFSQLATTVSLCIMCRVLGVCRRCQWLYCALSVAVMILFT